MNTDKKEFVCPWCIGGGAKLWEWAANPHGAIFTLLLRKSDESGGGDFYGYRTQKIELDSADNDAAAIQLLEILKNAPAMEGQPVVADPEAVVGRWAGDRVVLVGDYDSSNLWDQLDDYRNISEEIAEAWNSFVDLPNMNLEWNPECGCGRKGKT